MQGVELVKMSLVDAQAITEGVRPADVDWAPGYPFEATLVAAAMVMVADRDGRDLGPWGIFQVIRGGQVVAGMGFVEGPDPMGAVRIGFSETDAAREHGDTPRALAELIAHARAHGATSIRAEAGSPRAAVVLGDAGMREVGAEDGVRHFEA